MNARVIVLWLGAIVSLMLTREAAASEPPATQLVSVVAYGCTTAAKSVTIILQNRSLFGAEGKEFQVPATRSPDGSLTFSFSTGAGPIDWSFFSDDRKCMNGGEGLIVLPGFNRHILTSMNAPATTDWHARKFVAGRMPNVPIGVSIVASDTGDCPNELAEPAGGSAATIDGGAYYAGYMGGKHLFLELRSAGFDTLYIALPDATPSHPHSQFVRRDITVDDLKRLTMHSLNQAAQCIKQPSGSSEPFA